VSLLFILDTFGTRNVYIHADGHDLSVSCSYANNSHTRGCCAILTKGQRVVMGAFISSEEQNGYASYRFTGLDAGSYVILIYDLEQDGLYTISRRPAFIRYVVINHTPLDTGKSAPVTIQVLYFTIKPSPKALRLYPKYLHLAYVKTAS